MKKCAATIALALMWPAVTSAMTIECRDLTFDQRFDTLSVAVEQGRATVSSAAGRLLGGYAFEILHQSADRKLV